MPRRAGSWTRAAGCRRASRPEEIAGYGPDSALGRARSPRSIAPAYVFFSSPESSFVVGATLAARRADAGTP